MILTLSLIVNLEATVCYNISTGILNREGLCGISMSFKKYRSKPRLYITTVKHPVIDPALGLASEVGEFQGKLKRIFRDSQGEISEADLKDLKLELGDILWYVAVCADTLDLRLSDILSANLDKLADRRQRDVIKGEGDHR